MARVGPDVLRAGITALLSAGGMQSEKAIVVAEVLVEADLIGHGTHGTGLVEDYLDALQSGELRGHGDIGVLSDRGACVVWDGRKLPGAWLVRQALDLACDRTREHGVVTVGIRCSHHTGALAAYMKRVCDRGLIAQINCSMPSAARIAPFGGTVPVLTPNPMATGFPTDSDPVVAPVMVGGTGIEPVTPRV